MKKFYKLILAFILALGLSACSSNKNNKQLALEFFDAVHHTFQADSIRVKGSLTTDYDEPSTILVDLYLQQEDQLGVAILTTLETDGKTQPNFLDFYIKDGKTYLNSLGTKTQSTVDQIGLEADSKVDQMDPFLGLTDDQKEQLLENGKKEGDVYSFDINKQEVANFLDGYGSIDISKATVKATIKENVIEELDVELSGTQTIESNQLDTSIQLELRISDYDTLGEIPYPEDLDDYKKE